MHKRQRVALVGNSLLMDGVASNFEGNPALQVIRVDPQATDIEEYIVSIAPDAIVLDLDVVRSDSILQLLKDHPEIQLVGIDSECSRILVLSSSKYITPRMLDLMELIESRVRDRTQASS